MVYGDEYPNSQSFGSTSWNYYNQGHGMLVMISVLNSQANTNE